MRTIYGSQCLNDFEKSSVEISCLRISHLQGGLEVVEEKKVAFSRTPGYGGQRECSSFLVEESWTSLQREGRERLLGLYRT